MGHPHVLLDPWDRNRFGCAALGKFPALVPALVGSHPILWDAQEHFPALELFQSFHLGGGKNSGRKEEVWVPMSVQVQL